LRQLRAADVSIRQIGNSQGVVIPKPILAQLGLDKARAEMTIEDDAVGLRRSPSPARTGWADAPGRNTRSLRTVLVAPMTTAGREAPFRVGVTYSGRKGLILLNQVRAVDKARLAKRLGAVPARTLSTTLRTLREVFAE
jgi:mRNA interferase MazF